MVICPKCKSGELYYNQRVYEYHQIQSVNTETKEVVLAVLGDSYCDDEYTPFLQCQNEECGKVFDLDLTESAIYSHLKS